MLLSILMNANPMIFKRYGKSTSLLYSMALLLVFLCLAGSGYSQQAVVSSYFNASSYSDEWTELIVVTDNLDMRGWTLGDNNATQTAWMTPITFNNIPFWANVRAGTIIVVWHRINNSVPAPNPSDLLPGDGYLEVAANDPAFFTGGDFAGNSTLNISGSGDILHLKDAGGNQIHALGHMAAPGANWNALTCPKLNHNAAIINNTVVKVWDARNIIVMKRSMAAGYAAIPNNLFYHVKNRMLFGDAKATLQKLVAEIKSL